MRDKKFRVSTRIQELILKNKKEMGLMGEDETLDITNVAAENIIKKVLTDEFKYERVFNDNDKLTLIMPIGKYCNDINKFEDKHIDYIFHFLTKYYNDSEITDIITKIISKQYSPGEVYNLIRVSNKSIINFMKKFKEYIELYQGIIINVKFSGDVKNIISNIQVDENTGELTTPSSDIDDAVNNIINKLKTVSSHLYVSKIGSDRVVIASDDNDTIAQIIEHTNGLPIVPIPKFYMKWKIQK